MDSHQHHQRALCPRLTHGSLDLQRNDRLGRRRSHERFEHRREILRPIWSNANRDPHFYGNADTHCHCNADSNGDSNSHTYFYTETFTDTETGANASASTHPSTTPITEPYENKTHCTIRIL